MSGSLIQSKLILSTTHQAHAYIPVEYGLDTTRDGRTNLYARVPRKEGALRIIPSLPSVLPIYAVYGRCVGKVITPVVMKLYAQPHPIPSPTFLAFILLAVYRTPLETLPQSRQKTSSVFVSCGMEKGKYLKGYGGMFEPHEHCERIYEDHSNPEKCSSVQNVRLNW